MGSGVKKGLIRDFYLNRVFSGQAPGLKIAMGH